MKRAIACMAICAAMLLAACSSKSADPQGLLTRMNNSAQRQMPPAGGSHVPVRVLHNTSYVSIKQVSDTIGFQAAWLDKDAYGVGDHDAAWTFRVGESQVTMGDAKYRMPAPAVKDGEELFIPVSGLDQLFGDSAQFRIEEQVISFFDPDNIGTRRSGSPVIPSDSEGVQRFTIQSTVDKQALVAFAKRFMGVKYDFGAKSYDESGKFDCSSYIQHVFGKYGIDMPRLARSQGERGRSVSRSELQTGDLLFFYVPGRFKSDNVVGHVGIYIGGGDMIHASPKPEDGVQITPIDKPYWADTFMFAKRVL